MVSKRNNKKDDKKYYLYEIKTKKIIELDKTQVFDKLYYQECRIPNKQDLIDANIKLEQNDIKDSISKIEHNMPLYDIYTENLYLINKRNVYIRVIHYSYRFPEESMIIEFKNRYNKYKQEIESEKITNKFLLRKLNKLKLMIDFLGSFNLDILYDTYIKVFYKYSDLVGRQTSICKNPSFIPQFMHIKPYLSRNEIINTALNLNINIQGHEDELEYEDIGELCNKIKRLQITANTLLNHNTYIIESGSLGLVQYYSLQGSYFMNQYLRYLTNYTYQNKLLEDMIEPIWSLVKEAPEFDKSYVLYRFIKDDSYLKHLQIGETYIESGFMSTTRDPFYRSDLYQFGFVLIKITIPANIKGICLCLETISHFPEEQEIIFPPNTHFLLKNRDDKISYYHTDKEFTSQVKTRYEFEWVNNDPISFNRNIKTLIKPQPIDFIKINKVNTTSLKEKIKYFESHYVNELYQFDLLLGGVYYTALSEHYNSIGAYNRFYAIETTDGYSIYVYYKGYILFFIEIGESEKGREMHINYFVRYTSIDTEKVVGDDNLIRLYSSIAYFFDITTTLLYASYLNCNSSIITELLSNQIKQRSYASDETELNNMKYIDENKENKEPSLNIRYKGGSYCVDFYNYFKYKIKRYENINILNIELQPYFSYHDLDKLKQTSPNTILKKEDRDEIYQIYDKTYLDIVKSDSNFKDNIGDFYVWLAENKCYLLDIFIHKVDRLLGDNNPFKNDVYILDSNTYLYNRKLINIYPSYSNIDIDINRKNVLNKNLYREEIKVR